MRPRYMRAAVPPPMYFQERDGEIVTALSRYDGVLAKRHLRSLFWPGASWRAMEMRLSLLYHQGYLDWPNAEQWRTKPIPEPMCWLGWKGALWLAGRSGIDVQPPRAVNESQLRLLNNRLREQGWRWLREPRWNQLRHDLTVVDVRLAIERAVGGLPYLTLEDWVLESEFRAVPDEVEYTVTLGNGKRLHKKRGVIPDGYFVLVDHYRQPKVYQHEHGSYSKWTWARTILLAFFKRRCWPGARICKALRIRRGLAATVGGGWWSRPGE